MRSSSFLLPYLLSLILLHLMLAPRLYLILLLLVTTGISAYAQPERVRDSLENIVRTARDDKQKIEAMYKLARSYRRTDREKALKYVNDGAALARKTNYAGLVREGYLVKGIILGIHAEYSKALAHYDTLEQLCIAAHDTAMLGDCYHNTGAVYYYKADYSIAQDYYFKALVIFEKLEQKDGITMCYNNIASVYYYQDNPVKALEFYNKSLEIEKEQGDSLSMAAVLDNMALVYDRQGEKGKALDYQLHALAIFERMGNKTNLATSLNNIGLQYMDRGMYDKAITHLQRALALRTELDNKKGMASTLLNIGAVYRHKGEHAKAREYCTRGIDLALTIGAKQLVSDGYKTLAESYKETKDYSNAYKYITLHYAVKDSILNAKTAEQIANAEARYESEKKEAEIALLKKNSELSEKEKEIHELETNRMIMGLTLGVILLLTFAGFVYYNLRQKKAANLTLQQQNKEISHQKQEITDSINYARRIQESILPPDDHVSSRLPDSFILYKPKDIVSGDFYWVEKLDDHVLFAAVDCTGHGVPGALMSVVGLNLLNQAVHERRLTRPSDILSFLDAGVNNTLRQSSEGNSVKDGMDLALCSYDPATNLLQYAGAYNSLYIVQDNELKEIKADKFPIGVNIDGKADTYTNHEIRVKKGDCVYLFSDGYADQFGGPNGKKFKYNTFRQLLLSIHEKSMAEQRAILDNNIEQWRGSLEQVDDILVMGVRI
jgi:serine phosphatase RsbU (regulator of sigma subunit)/Tfp pilus assembly protein PilF